MTALALEKLKPIAKADVAGKTVLVRTDINVPMMDGRVSDATRLERLVPTIRDLTSRGARVVLMSHLGRPEGERKTEYSLEPVAQALARLATGVQIHFIHDCIGRIAEEGVAAVPMGHVAVLENVRFHPGEEKNAPEFCLSLARLGDLYVNDAFSCAHRAHASTEGLAHVLPAFAGPAMMGEIDALVSALEAPKRPVAAVVGGAKVSTKIKVLMNLVSKVDVLIIGGGMANTFRIAQGLKLGKSLAEPDYIQVAEDILELARENACQIVLPVDAVVASQFKAGAPHGTYEIEEVPADGMVLDLGSKSVAEITERVKTCQTLLWNGPLGAFEIAPFGEGTFALARAAAHLTETNGLLTIAGGGDTVAALNAAGVTERFTYVSTAGGAFLEWMEGRILPGVAALIDDHKI